ncbi:hypothetical protein DRP04_14995 [Archaeoglobales archaeon]|nr:MAG: hypothetical protein DRP04_14995 [Archaeoglobales archaeon]
MGKVSNNQIIDEILRLGSKCNFNCLFCNVFNHENPPELSFEEAKRKLEKLAREHPYISISGGEPLLYSYLEDLIRVGTRMGVFLNLQTNASLVTEKKAKNLKNAGLEQAFVNFPSHDPEIFAKITSTSRRMFRRVVSGIRALIDVGVKVALNLVVNEWNYRAIREYVYFVKENFPEVKVINYSVIQPHGNARINSYLVPDYREIKPYIAEGVKEARKLGFMIDNPFCGLPICMAPVHDETLNSEVRAGMEARRTLKIPHPLTRVLRSKIHTPSCYRCYMKNFCGGVWKAYYEIKGDVVEPPYEVLRYWPTSAPPNF